MDAAWVQKNTWWKKAKGKGKKRQDVPNNHIPSYLQSLAKKNFQSPLTLLEHENNTWERGLEKLNNYYLNC